MQITIMIKKALTSVILFFIATITHAQFNYAIKVGPNLANLYSNQQGMRGWRLSYHIGISASHPIAKKVYVSADLLYSDKGFSDGNKIHLSYISLPVLVGYAIVPKLSIQAGLGLNYLVSSFIASNGDRKKTSDIWGNKFDLGLHAGLCYNLNTSIKLMLRYEHGLSNVYNKETTIEFSSNGNPTPADLKTFRDLGWMEQNRNFQLSFCYVFFGNED